MPDSANKKNSPISKKKNEQERQSEREREREKAKRVTRTTEVGDKTNATATGQNVRRGREKE